ncbi:MAG: YceI family protein [Candidatus Kapabacteria bacterium]|nr:YceI family protein [Candidatus Kapabacteria bacterium]
MTSSIIILLVSLLVAPYGVPHDYPFQIEKSSKLYIEGTSNVNSFECNCKDEFDPQVARITLSDDERSVWFTATTLRLRTTLLDCDNSKMNRDLCEALKSEDYPYIRIDFHDAVITEGSFEDADGAKISCNASITITNVTRKVVLKVKGKKLESGRFRFFSTKELLMTDFGVEPPTAMLGLIRVRNSIRINFDIITKAG